VTCWALIPVKASAESKSRLAGVLDFDERKALVDMMLERVVNAARQAHSIARICLVGPSGLVVPNDVHLLDDPGKGLNPAVQSAFGSILSEEGDRPKRLIIVAADLPSVTARELDLLATATPETIAIAPDRHETGTNALSLPLLQAADFRFAFGTDSFSRHKAETERIGLSLQIVLSLGLEYDVDEPDDLNRARNAIGPG